MIWWVLCGCLVALVGFVVWPVVVTVTWMCCIGDFWSCWRRAVAPIAVAMDVFSASDSRRVAVVVSGGLLCAIVNCCDCGLVAMPLLTVDVCDVAQDSCLSISSSNVGCSVPLSTVAVQSDCGTIAD